jgi:hypothetical protein
MIKTTAPKISATPTSPPAMPAINATGTSSPLLLPPSIAVPLLLPPTSLLSLAMLLSLAGSLGTGESGFGSDVGGGDARSLESSRRVAVTPVIMVRCVDVVGVVVTRADVHMRSKQVHIRPEQAMQFVSFRSCKMQPEALRLAGNGGIAPLRAFCCTLRVVRRVKLAMVVGREPSRMLNCKKSRLKFVSVPI